MIRSLSNIEITFPSQQRQLKEKLISKECMQVLVYVDDLLGIGLDPRAAINILETDYNYVLNDFGHHTGYLGASIGTYELDDNTQLCLMGPDQ
jgi:hypothetical protein